MAANPKTEAELDRHLRSIQRLRQKGDFSAARDACQPLIENEATRAAGLRARASVYADAGQRQLEVADREELATIPPHEPADYFDLGLALWKVERFNSAAEAFTRGLEVGDREDFHYYTNVTRMHLVALLIWLRRYEEARRECLLLPDEYESYLPTEGVVTKEQLLSKIPPQYGATRKPRS